MHTSVAKFPPSYEDISDIRVGSTQNQYHHTLIQLITFAITLFPNKATFWGTGG